MIVVLSNIVPFAFRNGFQFGDHPGDLSHMTGFDNISELRIPAVSQTVKIDSTLITG